MVKTKVKIDVCGASQKGGRERQEDNYILYQSPNGKITITGVFDGHSSAGGGAIISKELVEAFKSIGGELDTQLFKNPAAFKNFLTANSFNIDQYLLQKRRQTAIDAGSTASLGFYDADSNSFYAYNVGDSRIVFFEVGKNGGRKMIAKKGTWHHTKDHKPSLQSEIDRIEKAGGFVQTRNSTSSVPRVGGTLALSRSFADHSLKYPHNKSKGDWVSVKPDIMGPYHPKGTFIAAAGSDGVWDQMSSQEITKIILEHLNVDNDAKSLQGLCKKIVQENIDRWENSSGADNVTITVMRIQKAP